MSKYVWCTFQFEGFHKWDGAKNIEEVSYLASKHRHIFHYRVGVEVTSNDREIEFIMLKHRLEEFVNSWDKNDMGSCESQAERLVNFVKEKYNGAKCFAEVSEDGENGALICENEETII